MASRFESQKTYVSFENTRIHLNYSSKTEISDNQSEISDLHEPKFCW